MKTEIGIGEFSLKIEIAWKMRVGKHCTYTPLHDRYENLGCTTVWVIFWAKTDPATLSPSLPRTPSTSINLWRRILLKSGCNWRVYGMNKINRKWCLWDHSIIMTKETNLDRKSLSLSSEPKKALSFQYFSACQVMSTQCPVDPKPMCAQMCNRIQIFKLVIKCLKWTWTNKIIIENTPNYMKHQTRFENICIKKRY